jgi:glucose dehydrogenase
MSRSGPTPLPHAALVVFLVLGLVACEAPGAIGSPSPPGSPSATVSAGSGGAASDPLDPESWEWRAFGGDPGFTRYAPLDQIDPTNVGQLQVLWRRPAVDPAFLREHPDLNVPRYLLSTPQMIDGVLYVSNGVGLVEAIDPGTGETLWMQEPPGGTLNGRSNRGLGYWTDGTHHRLLSVRGDRLYAVDRETGALDPAFGENGSVPLRRTGPGTLNFSSLSGVVVVGDVVVVTGLRGGAGDRSTVRERESEDVMGYDVRTGRHLWTFHVVPREGEFGSDTWGDGAWAYAGDAGSWCCMSADEELGLVYVPFSSPTGFYGGWRPGDNLFSNSLVAIDARTGERAWHFQAIRHGIWEHELAGAPALGEVTVDGRTIRVVMQPSKMGLLFVLDRTTGEPVWPMEERPVPASTVPGEVTAPTQPIPTRPAPFGRIGVTQDDLIDFTPELRASAIEFLRPYHLETELYAPPPLVTGEPGGSMGMLTVPGTWGAGNWHTGAFDPETGYYYAQAHVLPGIGSRRSGFRGWANPRSWVRRDSPW